MRIFSGTVVSDGIASGEALVLRRGEIQIEEQSIKPAQREREITRLKRAVDATRKEIDQLERETQGKLGDISRLLNIYQTLLDDQTVMGPIFDLIRLKLMSAPTAVRQVLRNFATEFQKMGEPFCNYAPELLELERRIIAALMGEDLMRLDRLPRPVVIIADELTPMQALALDRDKVLGFAMEIGSPESHTAILARHLGIPAMTGLTGICDATTMGARVIIDTIGARVVLDPDKETAQDVAKLKRKIDRVRQASAEQGPRRAITQDDVPIELRCNIDTCENAFDLAESGVQGVGLFRTEYLYLGSAVPPDEAAQLEQYRGLLKSFGSRPVVIRTMDFGADKFDHRVNAPREPNPFLGLRSIRLSFEREDLFRTQLRAILRASVHGNAAIMFPMIMDVADFCRARGIVESVKDELRAKRTPFVEGIPIGAMIEVPSAALVADSILGEAAFLSIGSNDLTQYTLAVDRTNGRVAHLYKPHHPAVCRLIRTVIEAGQKAQRPVSICGEMAGNLRCIPLLLGLGLRSLSMAAPRLFDVAERIRRVSIPACEELASAVLRAGDADESLKLLEEFEARSADRRRRSR